MIRLLIADDHGIVRDGLKQLFSLVNDIAVVAEASNGGLVLELVSRGGIDVLLLDMNMPGISGVELIERVRQRAPQLPILVLSMHNEAQYARRAIRAGASGYLTKDNDGGALLAAIRRTAVGGRVIDSELAEKIAFETCLPDQTLQHAQLSSREFEVLLLLARGRTVQEIGLQLRISHKTVSTHKARMMEKMGFEKNTDLIRYALLHQLVD